MSESSLIFAKKILMSSELKPASRLDSPGAVLSLYHLLDPEVLANPYPLFHRLRREAPVHWDSFLHAWIVTRYTDVLEVLQTFSANRTPTPEQLAGMGLSQISPLAELLVKQMLFMDAPAHTRLRSLASKAFTPARIQVLKEHIREIVDRLLAEVQQKGSMDVIADLAEPLPAIVTAEMLGVPVEDHRRLKTWSANFAEMLGNFQHNPDHAKVMLQTVEEMTAYFREAVEEQKQRPREGLIHSLLTAEIDGDRLTDDEIVANVIITLVGGLETTTNLIGNGILTLLRYPDQMQKLREDLSLIPSAVEEMLRFESPSQHTARLAPEDRELGGKLIRKRQAVIAIMAAANRDPERFSDPDRFDIARQDNRHLAFGYAAHFCFGAPLARIEGQIAFSALLGRLKNLELASEDFVWRENFGLRGLSSLPVRFDVPARELPQSRLEYCNALRNRRLRAHHDGRCGQFHLARIGRFTLCPEPRKHRTAQRIVAALQMLILTQPVEQRLRSLQIACIDAIQHLQRDCVRFIKRVQQLVLPVFLHHKNRHRRAAQQLHLLPVTGGIVTLGLWV